MESENKISQRSCSAVQLRTAGIKNINDCITGSLTNLSCIRQSVTATNFLRDILSEKFNKQKFRSAPNCNIFQNNAQNEMIFGSDDVICFCPSCTTLDEDLLSYVVQILQSTLQDLKVELTKEKNIGLILKRDILVAKKVVQKETGENTQDFETLLEKGNNKSWKGRQEIILTLKRKLRHLNETVACLDNGNGNEWRRKKSKLKTEEVTEVSEDRQIYWYLEFERQEVRKNMERYRQNFTISRNLMKSRLEGLNGRYKC